MMAISSRSFFKRFFCTVSLCTGLLLASANSLALAPPEQLLLKPLQVGSHAVQAEIVSTPSDRARGLMFREKLATHQGMLFVFEESAGHCFWMRNTPLPLSIGFFDAAGALINVLEMKPFDESPQCPTKPAKFALEMNTGWFDKQKLKPGAKLSGYAVAVKP